MRRPRPSTKSLRTPGLRPLGAEPLEPRLALASYTVTSLADSGPGTLRSLIEQANQHPAADEISFGKLTGTITLQSALPMITTDLKIGATRPLTIDAKGKSTIFGVDGTKLSVSFDRLTLVNARSTESGATLFASNWLGATSLTDVVIKNSRVNSRYTSAAGGAIANMAGTMTLENCTISGCVANGADTDYGALGARGGGIYSNDSISVRRTTLRNNQVIGSFAGGGAIFATGSVWVEDTVIDGNT
ncbi:MAG: right-handed parallel beta-helix repeat-containing protein, partial [Actinomycetota bacterium]